jgi:hypothetical protein
MRRGLVYISSRKGIDLRSFTLCGMAHFAQQARTVGLSLRDQLDILLTIRSVVHVCTTFGDLVGGAKDWLDRRRLLRISTTGSQGYRPLGSACYGIFRNDALAFRD